MKRHLQAIRWGWRFYRMTSRSPRNKSYEISSSSPACNLPYGPYTDERGIERSSFGVPLDSAVARREWEEMGRPVA